MLMLVLIAQVGTRLKGSPEGGGLGNAWGKSPYFVKRQGLESSPSLSSSSTTMTHNITSNININSVEWYHLHHRHHLVILLNLYFVYLVEV